MIREAAFAFSLAAIAPFQCGSGTQDMGAPAKSDGDALYDLAQDFHAKGNEDAAKQTLRYLIEHYPSNRHVEAAKAELGDSK